MLTLFLLLGMLMALPYDAPGHRPASEVKQQADATRVNLTQAKVANFLKLIQLLHATQISPAFSRETGLSPEFIDSLGALTGGMPTKLGTETSNRGEFWPLWPNAHSGEMNIASKNWPGTDLLRSTPEQMRATTAHEFGHLFDAITPGAFEQFLGRNPNAPAKAAYGGRVNVNQESFADAFAQAVRHVFPQIGEESAYQYRSSYSQINPRQQALLDSLVKARLSLVR
jgi:hypothetical protein